MITRASSILILAGILAVSVPEFVAGQDPTPSPTPLDKQYIWKNTGTDFNNGNNWTPNGGPPVAGDVGAFNAAAVTQPQLTASDTISGLYFTGTGTSGYDLTRSGVTQTLTLTGPNPFIGSENGNPNQTVAIGAENTSGTNTIDVPIILAPSTGSTSTIFQAAGGTLLINGVISGTGISLSKTGGGTLTLSGANTYTGGTSVTAGTLLVNNTTGSGTGTGAVTVNGSGTTLGGTGTISGTVTLGGTTPGAILNPGPKGTNATSGSVGTLTTGALTLTGANTVHIDAFGTATSQWDKLVSTGAISLGTTSALDVTIASGLTFIGGTTYVLLNGTSLTGTFSGIADNQTLFLSGYYFTADYTSTGFDLVAVPEPGTWCAAALTLGAILLSQRRRLSRLLKVA